MYEHKSGSRQSALAQSHETGNHFGEKRCRDVERSSAAHRLAGIQWNGMCFGSGIEDLSMKIPVEEEAVRRRSGRRGS
jgi:hypothetical protein